MIPPIRSATAGRATSRVETPRPQSAAGQSFASATRSTSGPAAGAPVQAVTSLDALMALQTVDGAVGRRARATRRGAALLDDLDALKLAILEGRAGGGELDRISRLIDSARETSGDEELDALIDDIELRAQVEIAKYRR